MAVERWSTAQVVALAPDAGSLRGARSVGMPAAWQHSGLADEVLWGLCRGSGKNPYQVCVDLSGPAYRCSCPSRRFPCKHALGLLLLWAAGQAGDTAAPASTAPASTAPASTAPASTAPAWVTEWRQTRTARAAKAAAPKGAAPSDPAAAERRARQRGERVAAGMSELRRWLDDQVQQGLAGAEHTGHRPYDEMAARLVDAQAPTVAGAVRRLGHIPGTGRHWADRLLGELALLRLLVCAYDRLDELPDDLAATVRTRIGFPTSTEQVLARPAIRDRWQVLGQVESENDTISTRSTWLRGADTGRFALLLAFAAPGAAFPIEVAPGTEVDADLHFHPGAQPLRAAVGARHAAPRPLLEPAGAVPVREALAGWSAALAAEPWRRSVPVLLADVAPTADGHLVDRAGDALPPAPGHREPWWLLAAAGGNPTTVAGEWSPDGLRPLAAWPRGTYVTAAPDVPAGRDRSLELPPDLVAAALVGTARRPWSGAPVRVGDRLLSSRCHAAAGSSTGGGPARAAPAPGELLESAAVALTYRRAATTPARGGRPVPPAPAERTPEVGAAAAARLRLLLSGGGPPGGGQLVPELLAQWLAAAAARGGVIVPPDALPALLDAGRRRPAIRAALARTAGERGRWLAARRAEWGYLLDEVPAGGAPETATAIDRAAWDTGSIGERVDLLTRLRRSDPAAARELLAATFDAEAAEHRVRFVEVMEIGLRTADDAFLEHALDDRRREVRDVALSLLRRLPASAFGRRMAARALACVRHEIRAGGGDRLVVSPPTEIDIALRRDGVPARAPANVGLGAWLLQEIVAGTPLDTWTALTARAPAAVLELAVRHDWQTPLMHGWARAAAAQRDVTWAAALVAAAERPGPGPNALPQELAWDLHLVLPPVELARFAAQALRTDPGRAHRLLAVSPGPWPDELATAVLEHLARRARTDKHAWQLTELCRSAATALPHHYAVPVAQLARRLGDEAVDPTRVRPVAQLADILTFRHEMHQEIA